MDNIKPVFNQEMFAEASLPSPGLMMSVEAWKKAKEFVESKNKNQAEKQILRLYLDGKGCDGFYYGIGFDKSSYDDLLLDFSGVEIAIDKKTYIFLYRSLISWSTTDEGEGFLVINPDHRSFRGKFYKSTTWEDKIRQRFVQNS